MSQTRVALVPLLAAALLFLTFYSGVDGVAVRADRSGDNKGDQREDQRGDHRAGDHRGDQREDHRGDHRAGDHRAEHRGDDRADRAKGALKQVFMPESDASNFFKRRSRRSAYYYAEAQAELRFRLAENERRKAYNAEQRSEFENYVEEERDEQSERTRESHEQVREYHYDGLYPRYYWFH
ncbi:upper zone of growth plate and cartilage matrix associated a isoform X2 [Nelusetta ayraudi]|uniref:upper zone of growth plate and cartilage matrix associated a isoform X2 n=1 Tax=Nelusetta ayraudi TaxID=303726 RepID=UPI003F6FADE0